jgi:hypothetical protein
MTETAQNPGRDDVEEIADEDRDSLHTLPIQILPITTRTFRRARLVKNSRLESVVELFSGAGSGRGQIEVSCVGRYVGLDRTPPHPDVKLLQTVASLPSFDVYSLRILLRAKAISVADSSALKLSPAKIASLSNYMAHFTRPLVTEVFGRDTTGAQFTDIVGMFRGESATAVRERLTKLADRLGITIDKIPKFLEDYADIFMSLSYYRQCLDELLPQVENFMEGMAIVRGSQQLGRDRSLMETVGTIEAAVNGMLSSVTGKIESFERSTNDMWRDLTADRFQRIETLVSHYHTSIGGALCAMSVKMDAWTSQFPNSSGGVARRAAFIMSDMRQGIEHLQVPGDDAPMLALLNS